MRYGNADEELALRCDADGVACERDRLACSIEDGVALGADEAGLVESRREGRETRYELTPQPLAGALDWMADVGVAWDARLARLRKLLSGGSRSGGGGARRGG